jgi:hypothetical protein
MASNENDSEVMERRGRGRRRAASAPPSGGMSTAQMLWADLRKRPVSSEPSDDELAYLEMEEAARREAEEARSRAHNLDDSKVEQMRRRYGVS